METQTEAPDQVGQSLIELIVAIGAISLTLVGGGNLLMNGWHRLRCAQAAFQGSHSVLLGDVPSQSPQKMGIQLQETTKQVTAVSWCRSGGPEKVGFMKMEELDETQY